MYKLLVFFGITPPTRQHLTKQKQSQRLLHIAALCKGSIAHRIRGLQKIRFFISIYPWYSARSQMQAEANAPFQ